MVNPCRGKTTQVPQRRLSHHPRGADQRPQGLQGLGQLDVAASLCEARVVALHRDGLKVRAPSSHMTYSQSELLFERNQHGFIRGGSSGSHVLLLLAEAKHIRALDRVGTGKYQDRPWPPLHVQTYTMCCYLVVQDFVGTTARFYLGHSAFKATAQ